MTNKSLPGGQGGRGIPRGPIRSKARRPTRVKKDGETLFSRTWHTGRACGMAAISKSQVRRMILEFWEEWGHEGKTERDGDIVWYGMLSFLRATPNHK